MPVVAVWVAILAVLPISHSQQAGDVPRLDELRRLEHADPSRDLQGAISVNDLRFIGIMGYALEVPGVEHYHERYASSSGVKIVEGTSDVIYGVEHRRLIDIAREYAEKYNRLLLRYLENQQLKR